MREGVDIFNFVEFKWKVGTVAIDPCKELK